MTQDGFELVVLLLLLWTVGVISIGCHIQLSLSMYIKKFSWNPICLFFIMRASVVIFKKLLSNPAL